MPDKDFYCIFEGLLSVNSKSHSFKRPESFNRPTSAIRSNYYSRSPKERDFQQGRPLLFNAENKMSIIYDWYENPNAEGDSEERGLHPRPFLNGKTSTAQLCQTIHKRSSLTVGDVKSALSSLTEIIAEELRDGREVHIEGLGFFAPTLQATQKVTGNTPNKSTKVRLKGISFRSDTRLKSSLAGIHISRSKYARHSQKLSEAEIDIRLKEYFAEHDVMIRIDFQELCRMTRTTANLHLRRLQDEGKLLNVGRRTQPIYRPAPGYYGTPHETMQKR